MRPRPIRYNDLPAPIIKQKERKKPIGLGDTTKHLIENFIGPRRGCSSCKKRQDKLNKMFPYKKD